MRWDLVDHICRFCFGRILHSPTAETGVAGGVYRCSLCGATSETGRPNPICPCGIVSKLPRKHFRCEAVLDPAPGELEVRVMLGSEPVPKGW